VTTFSGQSKFKCFASKSANLTNRYSSHKITQNVVLDLEVSYLKK